MAANSVRCPRDRGESVKGGLPSPFHKKVTTNRNSPKRAEGARGSFDSRREAPGGCRTGSDPNQNEGPEATSGQDPVRGPLDGFEDPEPAVRFRRGIARQGVVLSEWESTKYGPPLRGPRESALRGFARQERTFARDTGTMFEGRAITMSSGGASFERGLVSDRGAARRRERSDRSDAAPRSETSARVHPPHAPPSARRSAVAGTRRRASSSFSR